MDTTTASKTVTYKCIDRRRWVKIVDNKQYFMDDRDIVYEFGDDKIKFGTFLYSCYHVEIVWNVETRTGKLSCFCGDGEGGLYYVKDLTVDAGILSTLWNRFGNLYVDRNCVYASKVLPVYAPVYVQDKSDDAKASASATKKSWWF